MACFRITSAVTVQPSLHHVEQAMLLDMVNPRMGVSLGDWPPPPRSDYYDSHHRRNCGSERGSDSRIRRGNNHSRKCNPSQWWHHDIAAATKQQLAVGTEPWTITTILLDCMAMIRDADANEPEDRCGSGSSGDGVVKKMKPNKNKDSNCSLVGTVQLLLGRESGDGRRVAFKPVPEIKYIDKCRQLFPPTLEGREMKREAFWSVSELEVNRLKWDGHLEDRDEGRNGRHSCECLGCVVDREEAKFN